MSAGDQTNRIGWQCPKCGAPNNPDNATCAACFAPYPWGAPNPMTPPLYPTGPVGADDWNRLPEITCGGANTPSGKSTPIGKQFLTEEKR